MASRQVAHSSEIVNPLFEPFFRPLPTGSVLRNRLGSGRPVRRGPEKRGAVVIEMAVCLPILVVILFSTIECCNMLFIAQSLKITAFEGARVGVVPGAESSNVQYQCEQILLERGVNSATVTTVPSDPASLAPGDYFQVNVSANYASNSLIGGTVLNDNQITRSVSLRAQ